MKFYRSNKKNSADLSTRLKYDHWRIKLLWLVILVLGLAVVARLFWLQIWQGNYYADIAANQRISFSELQPTRGTIFNQDTRVQSDEAKKLYPVATDKEFYLVYAETYAIVDPAGTVDKLNSVLNLPPDVLDKILGQVSKYNDPFEPLVHRVTEDKIFKLKELNLPGIKWQKENQRYYPENNIGSQVVGFLGIKNNIPDGQYGVEGYFDSQLRGKVGFSMSEKDATGQIIGVGEENSEASEDGANIVLTIDDNIQNFACAQLDAAVKKHGADAGAVIVMDPRTGKIIAMCGAPDFDPNDYKNYPTKNFANQAIFSAYEPGSVFKVITMAAALDQEKVTPETTYNDTGSVKYDNFEIKNSDLKAHGVQTMVQVLENSLNTGAIFAMRQIGPEIFKEYVNKFGFGVMTGIELETEVAGNLKSLDLKGEIYSATASFGQGIMVTPLQMVVAYSAIANQGKMMKPYIIDRIISPDGKIESREPEEVRQVISPRAAALVSAIMVQVVEEGHAKRAQISGYRVAGKTGTAQVAGLGTGKYGSRTIHTFIAFAPMTDTAFVMLTRLDDPKDCQFAESSAVPLWSDIAKFILNYYQIKPDKE